MGVRGILVGFLVFSVLVAFLMALGITRARQAQIADMGGRPIASDELYLLTNDGQSIRGSYGGNFETDLLQKFGKAQSYRDPVQIAIREVDAQTSSLKIKLANSEGTHVQGPIGDAVWSRKHQMLFFVESSRDRKSQQLWAFDAKKGFSAISKPHGYINTMSLSLDQDFLVARATESSSTHPIMLVYSIPKHTETSEPYPSDALSVHRLAEGDYLILQNAQGKYGRICRLRNGKAEPLSFDGAIVEATILDGDIWAVRHKESKIELVQLDKGLTKIAQNLGSID